MVCRPLSAASRPSTCRQGTDRGSLSSTARSVAISALVLLMIVCSSPTGTEAAESNRQSGGGSEQGAVDAPAERQRHFKRLAGPPEEFAMMAPPDPIGTGIHSASAMLPIELEEGPRGRWTWDGSVPIEHEFVDLVLLTPLGDEGRTAQQWDLHMVPEAADPARSVPLVATRTESTGFPLLGQELPSAHFRFHGGQRGPYRIEVEADGPGKAVLIALGDGPVRLFTHRADLHATRGEKVAIIASAYDADAGATGIDLTEIDEAWMRVRQPDGTELIEELFDDGRHGDGSAHDGIFAGSFRGTQTGQVPVSVLFRGRNIDGSEFLRTTEHIVAVVDRPLRVARRAVTASLRDSRKIAVPIPITGLKRSASEETFHVYAQVWGRSAEDSDREVPVAWIGGRAIPDAKSLGLELDRRWIDRAEAVAPFELREVRVQNVDFWVTVSTADSLPLVVPAIPRSTLAPEDIQITESMLKGDRPEGHCESGTGYGRVLVHGWCGSNLWGTTVDGYTPYTDFPLDGKPATRANTYIFKDLEKNRTIREFADILWEKIERDTGWKQYSIIAHSQGGMASMDLLNREWTGLDCTGSGGSAGGAGFKVQSVGTPYRGTKLAGNLAWLGEIFKLVECGKNPNLEHEGAENWLHSLSGAAREHLRWYRTKHGSVGCSITNPLCNDYCKRSLDRILLDDDDGVVETRRAKLCGEDSGSGCHPATQGEFKSGQCHTTEMKFMPQYLDSQRNQEMNGGAASGVPDLTIESRIILDGAVAADPIIGASQSFEIDAIVNNEGGRESAHTRVVFYHSEDSTIDPRICTAGRVGLECAGLPGGDRACDTTPGAGDGDCTGDDYLGQQNFLPKEAWTPGSLPRIPDYEVSGSWYEPGTHYFGACVSPVTWENPTTNNCSEGIRVDIIEATNGPNLAIDIVEVQSDPLLMAVQFSAEAVLLNIGNTTADVDPTITWYASTNSIISPTDTELSTSIHARIEPGATKVIERDDLRQMIGGPWYIGACVKVLPGETATSDNCSRGIRREFEKLALAPAWDLEMQLAALSNTAPTEADNVTGTVRLRNRAQLTSPATTLSWYRSNNPIISSGDSRITSVALPALPAGQTTVRTVQLGSLGPAGTWYLGACSAPAAGEETWENNCSEGIEVTIAPAPTAPDLQVTTSVNNTTPRPGGDFTASAVIRNTGTGDSPGTRLTWYRSETPDISPRDEEMATDQIAGLAAGANVTKSTTLNLANPGTYYIGACVSPTIPEVNTGNNCSNGVEVNTISSVLLAEPQLLRTGTTATLTGVGFTAGSVVNAWVSTGSGPQRYGPFDTTFISSEEIEWEIPASINPGRGYISLRVINTDEGFFTSNTVGAPLAGNPEMDLPTITHIDAAAVQPPSQRVPLGYVEKSLKQRTSYRVDGSGFRNPIVNLFTATGRLTIVPQMLSPDSLLLTVPAGATTGPGAMQVINRAGNPWPVSATVSVPIGARIDVSNVRVSGGRVYVTGSGFSPLTVINLFNRTGSGVTNLGGRDSNGDDRITLENLTGTSFDFPVPANANPDRAYLTAINPPFITSSSTAQDPDGAFRFP